MFNNRINLSATIGGGSGTTITAITSSGGISNNGATISADFEQGQRVSSITVLNGGSGYDTGSNAPVFPTTVPSEGFSGTITLNTPSVASASGFGVVEATTEKSSATDGSLITDTSDIARALSNVTSDDHDASRFSSRSMPTSFTDSFTTERVGATIKITKNDGGNFSFTVEDGLGGAGLKKVHKEVADITDLPLVAPKDFKIKVGGNAETGLDDFYCKFVTNDDSDFNEGYWEETAGFGINTTVDTTTMPQELINTANNSFELSPMNFAQRQVGDDNTNPMPSFKGKKINNIFSFKNRLGFLSEDNIILSEAGFGVFENNRVSYNFFRTTTQSLLDSDPIDVTVASPQVVNLRDAVGFQENLILFADNGQFALKSGTLLTPSTVSIAPITSFDANDSVKPIALGSYLYFAFNRQNGTGIREFIVNSTTDNYDATEITEHVPTYIPKDITVMKGNSSEDIIAAYAPSTPSTIYIYKYFWSGNKKLLSSWSKFIFDFEIRSFNIFEGVMFIIATKESKTHLLKIPVSDVVQDSGLSYSNHLDIRKKVEVNTAKTFSVRVTDDGTGYQNVFNLDRKKNPALVLNQGVTYTFDLSDSSNSGHDLRIGSSVEGGIITSGVTITGTAGTAGAKLEYTPASTGTTHYFCNNHSGMGNSITTIAQYAINLEYTASAGDTIQVWDDEGNQLALSESMPLSGTATLVTLASAHTGTVYVGIPYTMKYTFTNPFVKLPAGQSTAPSGFVKNKIRNGAVFFTESSGFDVKVTPNESVSGATEYTNSVTDSVTLDTGVFKFPVFGDVGDTKITVESDSPFPSKFTSAEFEIFFHQRARRSG
tara:strand:+ start:4032 stop:6518 length:2487 start_codon:yes stop_codon:yes gene_type:complete